MKHGWLCATPGHGPVLTLALPPDGAGDSHHSGHRARVTPEGLLCAVPGHSCVRHPLNGVVHTAWLVRVEAPACSMTARHTGGTRRRQHSRPKVWVLAAVGVATGAPSQAGQHAHTHTHVVGVC